MASDQPDRPTYQLHLASLLLADGRKEEALGEFRVLLGRNANGQIWAQAGSLLLRSREYALARDFLQRASAGSSAARLDLAIALFYADGPGQALASLDKLPAEEATGDVFLLKADVLHSMGRQVEAEEALHEGLEKASSQPQVAEQAVPLLVRLDRKQGAVDLLAEVIRKNPEDSDLPLLKAIVLGLMQQFAEAEKTLREIELRWPEWDRVYLAHGLLLELAKKPLEARQRLQTAAALGSQDPGLACAEARLAGQPEPAAECACLKGLEQLLFPRCADRNNL